MPKTLPSSVVSSDNHHQNYPDNQIDDAEHLGTCGMGSWRPKWLQVFASPLFFTVNFTLIGIIQSLSGTYMMSNFSTLEKRFGFDSKMSSAILIADQVMEMLISPFIGYLGTRFSRPRLLAFGQLVQALAMFINVMPYMIYGPGTHLLTDDSLLSVTLAKNETRYESCPADPTGIDCSGGKHSTVWPAFIIFLVGGAVKGFGYTTFWVIGTPYIDDNVSKNNSPMYLSVITSLRLIGPAGGFLLSGLALRFYENPFWMLQSVKRLFKNKLFVFNLAGNVFRHTGFGGYYINKTKYIESQFRQTSSGASILTGTTSILPMTVGIMISGMIIKYIKPRPITLVVYMFAVEWFANAGMFAGMFIGCPPLQLPHTLTVNSKFTLNAVCNDGCNCTTSVFTPICSADRVTTYFSPCYAGCTTINRATQTMSGCECIGNGGVATAGYCPSDTANCDTLYIYLLVMTIGGIITSTASTAFVPYPLIFGTVVDSACLVWESKCGKSGNCWLYDQDRFRYTLHGTALAFITIGSLFDLGIIYNANLIQNFYDEPTGADVSDGEETDPKMTSPSSRTSHPVVRVVLLIRVHTYSHHSPYVHTSEVPSAGLPIRSLAPTNIHSYSDFSLFPDFSSRSPCSTSHTCPYIQSSQPIRAYIRGPIRRTSHPFTRTTTSRHTC
ncbi:unnamed protein product [Medioppia subpectinata]|uniref:Kazal-like domain-containing protein n=1 Tax=Medioppia subpectinata TaxID=1979941 RepID=A0A7R9KL79_9ACAR|nr:unnamed protein product [Medioppia subpectinata]CAG2104430.1 unnamed protein product [Medioppia subpectinata]